MNLVIHELQWSQFHPAPLYLHIELLIGGPNQSHKVNFKEPPSFEGKEEEDEFRFIRQEFFRKISDFLRDFFGCFLQRTSFAGSAVKTPSVEGSADNAVEGFGLKKFFYKSR